MLGLAGHAGWYDRGPGLLARPLYRRIAADVAGAGLSPGAVVLDVGTGPGRVPLLVARRCPGLVVEGVDLSAEMIERATRTATAMGASAHRLTLPGRRRPGPPPCRRLRRPRRVVPEPAPLGGRLAGLAEIRRVLRPGAEAWIYDVRPVLGRVAATAAARGVDLAVRALGSDRPGGEWRLLAPVTGRLVARMTRAGRRPLTGRGRSARRIAAHPRSGADGVSSYDGQLQPDVVPQPSHT